MAYYNETHRHGFSATLHDFVAHVRGSVQRTLLYRQTVAELGNLSDRELADLHLNRSMIQNVAQEAVYGK